MMLFVGVTFGLLIAAVIAGLVWIHLTSGDDHPLTDAEIRERIEEVYR